VELIKEIIMTSIVTVRDVLPIAIIVFGVQIFVIRKPIPNLKKTLLGFVYRELRICI